MTLGDRPSYCPWCGTPIDGARFCTNCGREAARVLAANIRDVENASPAGPEPFVMRFWHGAIAAIALAVAAAFVFAIALLLQSNLSDAETVWCENHLGAVVAAGRSLDALPSDGPWSRLSESEVQAMADAGLDGVMRISLMQDWDSYPRSCKVAYANR